ncbi:MAG: hypothetical protein HDS46_05185 [Bacteroides sp.]|nr:hypothetical protein [Bacteroides sp.]
MKGLKSILFAAATLIAVPAVISSCSDWTEAEPEDFYVAPTPGYQANLKDYFNSPHKVTFGWFGNWVGTMPQNSLCGLPDSVDYVGLWLCWGNLTPDQQADLDAFHARGSRTVMSWTARNIGENLTPEGYTPEEYWGFTTEKDKDGVGLQSRIEAAKRYAQAIVDTCTKYRIGGFDLDMEATGTLMSASEPQIVNEFLRYLRAEFDKQDKWLCVDIPGGSGWAYTYYGMLDSDVVESLNYIMWQTYEIADAGIDSFFDYVKQLKPAIFEKALAKSVICATFERAQDKHFYLEQSVYRNKYGLPHAGQGAYHIEYDYPGNPDYSTVRRGIAIQNPPINN